MPEIVYLYASIRDELKTQKVKPQQMNLLMDFLMIFLMNLLMNLLMNFLMNLSMNLSRIS